MNVSESLQDKTSYAAFDKAGRLLSHNIVFHGEHIAGFDDAASRDVVLSHWAKNFGKIEDLWTHKPKNIIKIIELWQNSDSFLDAYDHEGHNYLLSSYSLPDGSTHFTCTGLENWRHQADRQTSLRDITDRKRAENREETTLEAITDAIQTLTDGIALYDTEFNFVLGNDRFFEMWFNGIDPAKAGEHLRSILKRIANAGLILLSEEISQEQFLNFAFEAAESFEKNFFLETKTNKIMCSSHQTKLGGYLLEFTDVTEKLKAEEDLEHQRDIAHQNEKLSALGELLAGVAHELNNPLSIVVGYSQMLQGQLNDPRQEEKIDRIAQAAERSARIVKTFLAMARQKPGKVQKCDISEIVEVAIDVAGYGLRSSGIEIDFSCPTNLPVIAVDRDQMAQVFSNLIVNAEQAMEATDREPNLSIAVQHDVSTQEISVSITDNGQGMSANVAKRIFDPFFTTKEVGKGTGFGLAFCHRIVTGHQGRLTVESKPGVGTSFSVHLPAMQGAANPEQVTMPAPKIIGTGQKILIVDDETMVADLIAEMLSGSGYSTSTINVPVTVLDLLGKEKFDAIISDIKMPGLTGDQLMEKILAQHPEYAGRIGFITGDSLTENVNQFLETGKVSYIEKPVVVSELLTLAASLCNTGKDEK